jgi:hypothetical protein
MVQPMISPMVVAKEVNELFPERIRIKKPSKKFNGLIFFRLASNKTAELGQGEEQF